MINEINEENEKQFHSPVISRDSSSIRSARIKIKRRQALFIDPTNKESNGNYHVKQISRPLSKNNDDDDDPTIKTTGESDNQITMRGQLPTADKQNNNLRNSFDAAIEERLQEIDRIIFSGEYSDVDESLTSDKYLDDIGYSSSKSNKRSESTENLISMLMIVNDEKPNTLTNIKQLLNHESQHLCLLTTIQQYKYILQESKVSDEIIWNIFHNISDLIYAQKSLVNYLEAMTTEWDNSPVHFEDLMGLYTLLHVKCKDYVKNISNAYRELKILFEKHEKFKNAINMVTFEGKEMGLEVLIAKPVNWLCNSLEHIKSLIETADYECDRKKLEKTLQNLRDYNDENSITKKNTLETNTFLRSSLFVEQLPNDQRKLRHLFLFSGMVVCAKQKLQTDCSTLTKHANTVHDDTKCVINKGLLDMKSIERFEAKWFISLKSLVFHLSKNIESSDRRKNDIAILKDKIRDLRLQLITEKNKLHTDTDCPASRSIKRNKSNNFSFRKMIIKKDVDKFCHQMLKIQTELLLISPTIAFVISNGPEKPHTLLMPSVKDLEIWKCEILKAQRDQKNVDCSMLTLASISNILDSFRRYTVIIEVATSPLMQEDGVSGVIITNIFNVDGLNPDFRYYLSIEVDSFKLNELKARTKSRTGGFRLIWDESFDIDLDCSQMMNILLYELKNYGESKESLVGYFEFELKSQDMYNKPISRTVTMLGNDSVKLCLEASFKMEAKNDLMKRQPSIMKASLFGINIKAIVSREKGKCPVQNVPMILVSCLKKIEETGLDEEGIYRISGSKNEINELYKKLNKNVVTALQNISNFDLHTITGIVKMYLRELPEPLMISENYNILLEIAKIEDEMERFKKYQEVIDNLSEPNHSTVVFLLKHFEKVCSHSKKNQMIAGNLGLILGPTLIMPPCNPEKPGFNVSNIALETMHSMMLARVFTHIMHGVCRGIIVLP